LNDEAVHGLPRWRKLKEGDLLSIDCGVAFEGLYADSAITVLIGNCDERVQTLVTQTQQALQAGIDACQVGSRLGDVGAAIEAVAEAAQLGVVRSYCGHGIGTALHQDPQVPNWGPAGQGPKIEPGWCLAIEPVLTLGTPQVITRSDNWTVATRDGKKAAHFEMMVACTEQGPQILSLTSDGQWP
ncbi:MAG TPA: type I methionyl aminopeptidase, partial [Myxococcales bacterium]|nr:type I methionyl aminopeptidase [Myxococcales bacterium]